MVKSMLFARRFGPIALALLALPACNLTCPYSADQVFETQVRAECHFFFACCTAGEVDVVNEQEGFGDLSRFSDEENCVDERLEEGSDINLFFRGISQAEQAGRFRFDTGVFQSCVEGRINALNSCDADFVLGDAGPLEVSDECSGVPGEGLVDDGDPCFFDYECAIKGSQCLSPGALENPEACTVDDDCGNDEVCDDGFCAVDTGVIEIHDDKICIRPIEEGEDCSFDPDFPNLPPFCEFGTICITAQDGDQTCEVPREDGDNCLVTSDCERGLFCDLEGGIPGECTPLRGERDDCNSNAECKVGLFCDQSRSTPTCEAPLPVDVFICTGIQGAEDPNYPLAK